MVILLRKRSVLFDYSLGEVKGSPVYRVKCVTMDGAIDRVIAKVIEGNISVEEFFQVAIDSERNEFKYSMGLIKRAQN